MIRGSPSDEHRMAAMPGCMEERMLRFILRDGSSSFQETSMKIPLRSFSLNSDQAYAALCSREDRPWIPNGALPREPRLWERGVIVEKRRR